jgi:glycosyltransferase involved in cell wall biosynthesis
MSRIAFLMPTLNAQTYLVEAIGSLLRQSHADFDLFVLDGGSTDATLDICRALQKQDGRITILSTPSSSPSHCINDALDNLPHEYLLIPHADDVSVHERAARQVAFMRQSPELIVSGSNTHFWLHQKSGALDINHYSGFKTCPAEHAEIRCQLPFWWSFSIPSLILNGAAARENSLRLDDILRVSSDWWFYWQAAQAGRVANLQEPLISYRHHDDSDGTSQRPLLAQEARLIRERIARAAGFWALLSPVEAAAFLAMDVESNRISAIGDRAATEALMVCLAEWDAQSGGFEADAWKRLITGYMRQVKWIWLQGAPFRRIARMLTGQ